MSDKDRTVKCPNCAESVQAEAVMCRFCQRGLSRQHFKKCRYCGEMVRKAATKCRFCYSGLDEPPAPPPRPSSGTPVPRPSTGPRRHAEIALPIPDPEKDPDLPIVQSIDPLSE